jgi:ABC-type transport system involved in Fe-S cluster assembly, permease component
MHDPKVTYRSVFGIEQNPPQWKAAFERANRGLQKELVEALEPAWQVASELPMPHIKLEKWRWLDFSEVGLADAQVWTEPEFKLEVDFIPNGKEDGEQEFLLPQGLVITTFRDALQRYPELVARLLQRLNQPSTDKFQALAEALGREGLFVFVPRGIKLERLAVANLQGEIKPGMNVLRSLIWLEPGAELKLVLNVESKSKSTTNSLFHLAKTDLVLEEDALLHLTDVSIFEQEVTNLCYSQAKLGRGAKLDWIYDACATAQVKQSLEVNLEGEGAEVEVSGVYFPAGGQKVNVDTVQNHLAPHTKSNLLFRGAAIGDGQAIWRGMIYVDPAAQKSDGYQSNQNLLLGEQSEIKSIPGLEICADDVSCSHGATVGSIDATELFYLQTRGIPIADAERLIVEGFFAEIIEQIPDEKTRNKLGERLIKKFETS